MDSRDYAIVAEGLGKSYRLYDHAFDRLKESLNPFGRLYHREFVALSDATLRVRRGESLGVIGQNGSGKSTLLKMIAGIVTPSSGRVSVNGRLSALLELGAGFNPEMTGLENVHVSLALYGIPEDRRPPLVEDILQFADIGDFVHQPVKVYSSGMFVRLAFALATAVDPDILIVDEALAVGDMLFQRKCFQRIQSFIERGKTFIFVSHDYELVRTMTKRAILIDRGRVLSDGPSKDVVLEYRSLLHKRENPEGLQARAEAVPAFGDGDCVVTGVSMTNAAGERQEVFYPGDRIKLAVECQATKDVGNLAVGMRIRNKEGVKVYSGGTLNVDIAKNSHLLWADRFRRGQRFVVEFEIECRFAANLYEVQLYVSEEMTPFYAAQRMLYWKDQAAFFEVKHRMDEIFFGGIFDVAPSYRVTRWPEETLK